MILKILGITSLLILFGCGVRAPSGTYNLKPWPPFLKYSDSFYTNMSIRDRELMDQREWKLNEFRLDAQKLEAMHNRKFK